MVDSTNQIDPNSPEYKEVQAFAEEKLGHPNMYLSPWKHAAISVNLAMHRKHELFTAMRAEHFECSGKWHIPAIHVQIGTGDTIPQALFRAVKQKHGVEIDISKINEHQPIRVRYEQSFDYILQKDVTLLNLEFLYELTEEEAAALKPSDDAPKIGFSSISDLEKLYIEDKLVHSFEYLYSTLALYEERPKQFPDE